MSHDSEGASNKPGILVVAPDAGRRLWQPVPTNGSVAIRVTPEDVAMRTPYSFGEQCIPPGSRVPQHAHPHHDEFLHFLDGSGLAVLDGEEHAIVPGTTIVVGADRRHSFINTGQSDLRWLWFIQPNGLEVYFAEVGLPASRNEGVPEPFKRRPAAPYADVFVIKSPSAS